MPRNTPGATLLAELPSSATKRHTRSVDTGALGRKSNGVSPHVFRHSLAVGLLEQGVDVNVIRAWLGHVSLDTTHRYAEINLRTKQAAVTACLPPVAQIRIVERRMA